MKRPIKIAVLCLLAIGLLAVASWFTTDECGIGGFPAGEFRINVRDGEGARIKGAAFRVYQHKTRSPAHHRPFRDYVPGREYISDAEGQIVVHERYGLRFGGCSWKLLWIIPMKDYEEPQYDCEIVAEGYKPCLFSIQKLFESPYRYYDEFPKSKVRIGNDEIELPIYEHTFVLER